MLSGGDELHIVVFRSRTSSLPVDRLIAQRCWDLSELATDYQAFVEDYQPRLARYRRGLTGQGALVERMELIQSYRRYPFRDPDLPEPLQPAG